MTPQFLHAHVLPAAFALLPTAMNTPAARAMLIAIALQESRCCHRRQVGGPARGFWQFEISGVRGVLSHKASKPHLANVLAVLAYPVTDDATTPYTALEHNDVLAGVFARLLLWTLPGSLPGPDAADEGWRQYIDGWRPGKPHRETWDAYWGMAWAIVEG